MKSYTLIKRYFYQTLFLLISILASGCTSRSTLAPFLNPVSNSLIVWDGEYKKNNESTNESTNEETSEENEIDKENVWIEKNNSHAKVSVVLQNNIVHSGNSALLFEAKGKGKVGFGLKFLLTNSDKAKNNISSSAVNSLSTQPVTAIDVRKYDYLTFWMKVSESSFDNGFENSSLESKNSVINAIGIHIENSNIQNMRSSSLKIANVNQVNLLDGQWHKLSMPMDELLRINTDGHSLPLNPKSVNAFFLAGDLLEQGNVKLYIDDIMFE